MSSHALPPRQKRRRLLIGLAVVAGIVGLVATATVASGKTSIPSADETAATTARVLDASDWYLTLPTGSKGKPDTVQPAKLADYSSKWFHANSDKDGIVFTANVGGVTTSGSSYPRTELREMNGSKLAGWSNTQGTHTLTVRQAVTALPAAKPDVVTAQIHDSEDDVLEVRLEGGKLIASYNDGRTDVTLDPKLQPRHPVRPHAHRLRRARYASPTTVRRSSTSPSAAPAGTSSRAATCSPTPARATRRAPSASS